MSRRDREPPHQFRDVPQSIPDLSRDVEFLMKRNGAIPDRIPEIPMWLAPPAFSPNIPDALNPFIPRPPVYPAPGPLPARPGPGITPNMPKEFNPFLPLPDRAPPAVPDRPPTVARAEPSENLPSASRETSMQLGGDAGRYSDPLATLLALVRLNAMRDWPA